MTDQAAPGHAALDPERPGSDPSAAGTPRAGMSERVSDYARGSVANMARSLLVIAAIMAVLFFAVARVNTLSRPNVEVTTVATTVARETGWPIVVPTGLPDGWTVSNVRFLTSTDGLRAWHVGYQTPAGDYVAVEQTMGATDAWIAAQTNRAPKIGTVEAAGLTWDQYDRPVKVQRSLVHRATSAQELTTVITGTGSFDDLRVFAERLTPFGG